MKILQTQPFAIPATVVKKLQSDVGLTLTHGDLQSIDQSVSQTFRPSVPSFLPPSLPSAINQSFNQSNNESVNKQVIKILQDLREL